MHSFFPTSSLYLLKNAHIPECLLESQSSKTITREGLTPVDLIIKEGSIVSIDPAGSQERKDIPSYDLAQKIVFPSFVDLHTHLDRSHIWQRTPNPTGTFSDALEAVHHDKEKNFSLEDIYRRLEFSLKCSYAHGTAAIRTHIDCDGQKGLITLKVFEELQEKWSGRITLQAASLVDLKYYLEPSGLALADYLTQKGHVLGAFVYSNSNLEQQLDNIFVIAKQRKLKLDFHVDENGNPESRCLEQIAKTALKYDYINQVTCGHCCSLAIQSQEVREKIIALVKEAQIAVVSLPMCNLYLQDRHSQKTPLWRGITNVHELKAANIDVCFASDNCRDPFYGFGDLDMLEVLSQSVKIAHLDAPYGNWVQSVTSTSAKVMGINQGKIAVGNSADFIIFKARYFSELFARPQSDRLIVKQGKIQELKLPSYDELDDLIF